MRCEDNCSFEVQYIQVQSKMLQQISQIRQGINYLVPYQWWQEFHLFNQDIFWQSQLKFPILETNHLVDSFLIDFKQEIIQQIQQKSNQLRFQNILLSPQPKSSVKWKVIPPQLWKVISKQNKYQPILTYVASNQISASFPLKQIQIVYCSRKTSDLFVGFLPQNAPILTIIRQVGFQMGFIEMQNSKITFPDKNAQKNYLYAQVEGMRIKDSPDTFIMVFNLEKHQQEGTKKQNKNIMNISNQAMAGDLLTMIDESRDRQRQIHDGTLSTGAETPFSFFGSQGYDIDREYRMKQLFRDKKPQEIQAMKINANQAIQGQLIQIPLKTVEGMQEELQRMAQQMLEGLHTHKKKGKQKQVNGLYQ